MKTTTIKTCIHSNFKREIHATYKFLSFINRRSYYSVYYDDEFEMFIYYKGEVILLIHDFFIENLDFQIPLFGLAYFYINDVSFLTSDSILYSELFETFISFYDQS